MAYSVTTELFITYYSRSSAKNKKNSRYYYRADSHGITGNISDKILFLTILMAVLASNITSFRITGGISALDIELLRRPQQSSVTVVRTIRNGRWWVGSCLKNQEYMVSRLSRHLEINLANLTGFHMVASFFITCEEDADHRLLWCLTVARRFSRGALFTEEFFYGQSGVLSCSFVVPSVRSASVRSASVRRVCVPYRASYFFFTSSFRLVKFTERPTIMNRSNIDRVRCHPK